MERLALENPRSLEFLEIIDPSSWMDVARLGATFALGQTRVGHNGIRPLTPQAMLHGSIATNGAKLFHHWTKSRRGWRPACWTPSKTKPKNRLMSGAGDSRRDQMSLRQQLIRRLRRRE